MQIALTDVTVTVRSGNTDGGDMGALGVAVSAGLRVMPGDEELLRLQSSFLQTVREATVHSVA
jgi:hypothetical protein